MKKFANDETIKLIAVDEPFSKYVEGFGYAHQLLVLATATEVKASTADGFEQVREAVVGETVEFDLNGLATDEITVVGGAFGALADFDYVTKVKSHDFAGQTGLTVEEEFYKI